MSRTMRKPRVRRCRYCGCTDSDCRECVELTGDPCQWVGLDVCSACITPEARVAREKLRIDLAEMEGDDPHG